MFAFRDTGRGSMTLANDKGTSRKGNVGLASLTATKGRIAAFAASILLLASGGAYAALGAIGPEPAQPAAEAVTEIPVPMPIQRLSAEQPLRAADYSIASVFDGEAFLATSSNLVRVKVGAVVPGLGTITAVDAFPDGGGTVAGTEAVLRTR